MRSLAGATRWLGLKPSANLTEVYYQADPDTCLCGHYPVNEICVIRDKMNGSSVVVGNVCVKTFLELPSDKIFEGLHRVAKDPSRLLNKEAIEHAHEKGWISDWEKQFSLDTIRKRRLPPKQLAKRNRSTSSCYTFTKRVKEAVQTIAGELDRAR
jgi:hypothetical protein